MKILVSFMVVFFLLTGCSSTKKVSLPKKEFPSWYLNPSKTTSTTLHGVGEGKSRDEAIVNALNNIASTLNVYISSQLNIDSVVKEGMINSYQTTTTDNIQSEVKSIRISNYEILNYKELGFKHHIVSIKSDKRKLFISLQKELEQDFSDIENQISESKKYNAIKKLSIYKTALESTYGVKNTINVMVSLDSTFNGDMYLNKIQEINNKYEDTLFKISFSIDSNNDAKRLKAVILSGLSADGYSVKNTRSKNHFRIYVESDTIRAKSYGFDLARSAITIVVLDNNGVVIGSNKLNITGQSTQGYTYAKESVAMKLDKMIDEYSIASVLGLDI